ncbi:leucine-rich repeat and guanylate kinase domain-containing protein [Boleophthalmus pectinirostris]|uniref:leucine-rich repeat and guanylate kinase domain-containing protein n=1 Tax=Boleophthalmus pectinirostris TaxID=150288 RepID=UPI00242CA414|nr:leucine-rich repeat and guanylate kinase domain-containing protein [Boleophthalmus pectinirostris]
MPLQNRNLTDVSLLSKYIHLHKLELQNNKIKDLSCVSHMPSLAILDASHNEISEFFGFQPPKNLKEVNFSHNRMTEMRDLSEFSSLARLNLDNNNLSEICGLEHCLKLTHLSLANNKISRISSMDNAPLFQLNLSGNKLTKIEGLENQLNLQILDLSHNQISSLSGLQKLHVLCLLNLEKNTISEIQECRHICNLLLLRDLNLLQNPVQEQPDYKLSVIFLLQHLTSLDQRDVLPEEKVSAVNKYDPPLEVVAARDHMKHLVYQMKQPQQLHDSTLPGVDSPYPMLVLTGPQCCGKRELAHRLCQELSEYFAYGICHTTRGPYFGEEDGVDYHFVTEEDFQNMINMGKFIQTVEYAGHRYGLTRDAVEEVAREGLACCVHMELEGICSLKDSHFEPRYILLIPTQVDQYICHLKNRDLYSPAQIDRAVSRIEMYAHTHRLHPGFFDNVIASDDWDEAYQTLKQVVKGYLVVEEPGREETAQQTEMEQEQPTDGERLSVTVGSSVSPLALDPTLLSHRHYYTHIQHQLCPQKTPAELVSLRRRERLLREAIVGKSPAVFSHLFRSSTETGASSLQNHNPSMHLSGDSSSSSDESRCSSVLSVSSSAGGALSALEPVDSSVQGPALETSKDLSSSPEPPHPGTDPVTSERRPGSNMKTVLPPIPPGRRTPLAPSPAPSPAPSNSHSPVPRDPEEEENREGQLSS